MTKEKIKDIRADLDLALAEVAKKHGLDKIISKGALYKNHRVSFKVEAVEAPVENDPALSHRFALIGLPEDAGGKQITVEGKRYTIVGVNLLDFTHPVIIQSLSGKRSGFRVEHALTALGLDVTKVAEDVDL